MSEILSPAPSLLEERATRKRLLQKWIAETCSQTPIDAFSPPSVPASVIDSPTELYPSTKQAFSKGNVARGSGYTAVVSPPAYWGATGLPGSSSRSPLPQYIANQTSVPGPMPEPPITVITIPAPPNASIDQATTSMGNMKVNPSGTMAQVYPPNMNTATSMYLPNTAHISMNSTLMGNTLQGSIPNLTPFPAQVTTATYAPPAPITTHLPVAAAYTNSFSYPLAEAQAQPMATSTRHSHRSHQPTTYHHSSGRSRSHSRPVHRIDIDHSDDATRSRSAAEPVHLPPDYVPASPRSGRFPEHSRSRRTSVPPSTGISGTHSSRHGGHGLIPVVSHNDSLTLPYIHVITKHHTHHSTPHHSHDGHHHSHHHHDRDHSRHRSSSTHAPPAQHYAQLARPIFSRHRSRSVDAGNPRMTRSRPNETYPTHTQAAPSQYYAHQSAHSPTNTSSSGNYHVLHPSPTSPTMIQPPTHQPVVVPMGDGRHGWVIVPPQGQSVRVVHGHHSGSTDKESRGRSTAPGFFSRLFGHRSQSSNASHAMVYPADNRHHHSTARSAHYTNPRPRVLRRRSSR